VIGYLSCPCHPPLPALLRQMRAQELESLPQALAPLPQAPEAKEEGSAAGLGASLVATEAIHYIETSAL